MDGTRTVVIIDDAPFSRIFIRDALTGAGFTVVAEGADGFEAVDLYAAHKPDLLTLDLVMPGMDGMEALAAIRHLDPESRIIVCTSVDDEATLLEAALHGARDYVTKPLVVERLVEAALKAVERK